MITTLLLSYWRQPEAPPYPPKDAPHNFSPLLTPGSFLCESSALSSLLSLCHLKKPGKMKKKCSELNQKSI